MSLAMSWELLAMAGTLEGSRADCIDACYTVVIMIIRPTNGQFPATHTNRSLFDDLEHKLIPVTLLVGTNWERETN